MVSTYNTFEMTNDILTMLLTFGEIMPSVKIDMVRRLQKLEAELHERRNES